MIIRGSGIDSTVKLNICAQGANGSTKFFDKSQNRHTVNTVSDVHVSNSVYKFASPGVSINFASGSPGGGYLYVDGSSTLVIGTQDFSISGWYYFVDNADNQIIIDFRPADTNGTYPAIAIASDRLIYYTSSATQIEDTSDVMYSVWHYLALCRQSGVTKMYLDGSQIGSNYTDTASYLCPTNKPFIGGFSYTPGDQYSLYGYMDDLRIHIGKAIDGTKIPTRRLG